MKEDGTQANPSIVLVLLRWLLDGLWLCHAQKQWPKDVEFELCRRVPPRGDEIAVGGHNVMLFALQAADLVSYYVPEPS